MIKSSKIILTEQMFGAKKKLTRIAKQLGSKLFGIVTVPSGFASKLDHSVGKWQKAFARDVLHHFCDVGDCHSHFQIKLYQGCE